eukprot:CAMPEP_0175867352 /NCGR_PEP_ID=MMETSP0107_2-20121207/34759_1 /TAXON_ID=195067 ORGANISM="Goniomonas pacifica, Strain CCMP1869" /NCGR_SAMPLE_ID=MMETSP0107_2 /ASSEMBLY_ACC=CAM_ASM_000203 /LENGTH=113 /DNA_ID=CAMNT_0017185065 /DNA_START=151 /DNA_END=492 /DNA_ORIENTATION=+
MPSTVTGTQRWGQQSIAFLGPNQGTVVSEVRGPIANLIPVATQCVHHVGHNYRARSRLPSETVHQTPPTFDPGLDVGETLMKILCDVTIWLIQDFDVQVLEVFWIWPRQPFAD